MRIPRLSRSLRWQFEHNDGHLIDKWSHYFDVYERHFAPFRGHSPVVLEIGISHGGSLQMWRRYFGRGSKIVGVDIEQRVMELAEPGIEIHVGSQSDPGFLAELIETYGLFDIIIDDGSHWFGDQLASLTTLWPALSDGGVYLVEDVHTSYMSEYEGGLGQENTFIAETKRLVDVLHQNWIAGDTSVASDWVTSLGGVHVYDSVVVLDKCVHDPPVRRMTGRPAFETLYGYDVDEMINDDHRSQLASLGRPMARIRRAVRQPRSTLSRSMERVRRPRS